MALREIIVEGNPTLRKISRPVVNFDAKLGILLDDMKETLKKANGVGLAAPQVGILRRAFLIDFDDKIVEFINPKIVEKSGEQEGFEGCLSVPDTRGVVVRPMKVKVEAVDRYGRPFSMEMEELFARCACHEYDHLEGILYIDIAKDKEKCDNLAEEIKE